jgi:hypothetical protein
MQRVVEERIVQHARGTDGFALKVERNELGLSVQHLFWFLSFGARHWAAWRWGFSSEPAFYYWPGGLDQLGTIRCCDRPISKRFLASSRSRFFTTSPFEKHDKQRELNFWKTPSQKHHNTSARGRNSPYRPSRVPPRRFGTCRVAVAAAAGTDRQNPRAGYTI